ncbi:MAG: ABC transporter permease, partial [Deltaproteobacteria bacterium]|nr:ABC transporter permease [Deltaproteobacteria bacterium]
MALEAQIARRYLFGKERPFMAGLLTWVGILGIAIGVFALIVIQSVMTGFSQDLQKKILRFSPSLVLKPLNPSLFSGKKAPQLDATQKLKVTPYVDSEVILHTEEPLTQGVKLRGIELDSFFMKSLNPEWGMGVGPQEWASAEGELPGVLVGAELAKRLNLIPTILEEVELIYPFGEVDPTGEMRPKTRKFRVMGTFKTGYFDYDNKYAVID